MAAGLDATILKLDIEIVGQTLSFRLGGGEMIYIGSDPSCNLHLQGEGISPKHLSISFNEGEVLIQDVDSDEGTYRLPHGAPFVEFRSAENASLDLKLGNTPLKLTWSLDLANYAPGTNVTRVGAGSREPSLLIPEEATRVIQKDSPPSNQERSPKPERRSPIPSPNENVATPKSRPQIANVDLSSGVQAEKSAESTQSRAVLDLEARHRAFENLGLLFYLASVFRVLAELKQKLFDWHLWATPEHYRRGVALDFLYLYWKEPFFWRTLILGSIGLFIFLFLLRPLGRMLGNLLGPRLPSGALLFFSGPRKGRLVGIVISLLLMIWTPFLAFRFGLKTEDLPFFKKVSLHLQSKKRREFDFESVPKTYRGSSLLYKLWIFSEREDLINRCRSFGLDSWSGQKSCSVLFFSKTIEGYARFQPRIAQNMAASQVLLASLEGIIRVLSLEGPNSPVLNLFLDPLDTVGLGKEKEQILSYIATFQDADYEDMIKALSEMKHRMEDQAEASTAEIPKALQLRFPGLIEMGI